MVRELFKAEPDAWQLEALEAFPHTRRLAMKACAGPGKLEAVSTIIDTPSGPRLWGDLMPGQLVFAEDGSPTEITKTFPHGVQPIYKVTFDDGSYARVGADHLWKVRGRTERRHWKARQSPDWTPERERRALAQGWGQTPLDGYSVLTTEQIYERNRCNDGRSRRQFEIPTQGAAEFPRSMQLVDSYLAGVWIGDGTKKLSSYTKPYIEIEQEINRRGYETKRRDNGKTVKIYDANFRDLECFDRQSCDRFIPDNYKYASVSQRTDLLCGLMDTDGCIGDDSHMEYDTTSERLASDVVWLVRSLGGVAFIKSAIKHGWYRDVDGNRIDCRDCYRISVTLPFNPFRIKHKSERWHRPQQRYLTRYIDRIEFDGEEEAMCIEIAHPSHCYLTRDFIVTHNTALLAWLGWNFLLTRPHPIVGCTSVSGDNLKANLWTELARWRARAPLLEKLFDQTKTEIFSREHPKTWRMEARTWAKDADAQQIGNALAGLHAQYVMWLLDESGDYPDAIMPVCEGIFNGEPIEAHIVQAGNPTTLSGPLYRACTVARKIWTVIEITADPDDPNRTPRVSVETAREQIEQYGRDNPWVLVRIFGKFPPSAFNALIGPDEVDTAMNRHYREFEIGDAPKIMGVDVAAEGDDASVIFFRQGLQCLPLIKQRNITSTQGAGLVSRHWEDWNANACFIDNTGGFGSGWADQLRLLGKTPIGVHFAGMAHQKERYFNKRTEMYFDAVEWIKRGGALPRNPEIQAALTQTTYSFRGDRLLLEPKDLVKKKLGYSPDEADAFVLTFAEPVSSPGRQRRPNRSAMPAKYDEFQEMDALGAVEDIYRGNR